MFKHGMDRYWVFIKNLPAPWLEQVACLTEKRVVVVSKNNSRSRYLKSHYLSVLASDEDILFHQTEITDSRINVGRRIFVSERFCAENARKVPRES